MQHAKISRYTCYGLSKAAVLPVVTGGLFLLMSNVYAAAIGEFSSSGRIGYAVATPVLFVNDPDGETQEAYTLLPFDFIYTNRWSGAQRFWTEVYYQENTLNPTTHEIGQAITRLGARFTLQSRLNLLLPGKPWFGVGLQIAQENYSLRHTIDEEGFLLEAYPDRDTLAVSMLMDAATEWRLSRRWDVGAKGMYALPINDGAAELSVAAVFLYSF